jgi:hypothetical protein
MKTPEQRKKEALDRLTSFMREERFNHWRIKDILLIEAAIEAAYDAGKDSGDAAMKEMLQNISYCVERGYFNGKR